MASKTSDLIFRFIGKDETGAAAKSAASNLDHIGSKASGLGRPSPDSAPPCPLGSSPQR